MTVLLLSLRDKEGNIISEPERVSDLWQEHFSSLGQPSENVAYDQEFKTLVECKLKEYCASLEEMAENVLNEPITVDEVKRVCTKLKLGKAQDYTALSYEHLKYAGNSVYKVIAYLFNRIVTDEYIPDVFKRGITLALFKGGDKDSLDTNSYRGITIQSVLCKVYESVLCMRATPVIKDNCKISETQSACCKGLSSVNASFILQECVSHNVENESNTFVTFFDTRKAFDTVWISGLLYMLYNCGIKGKLWRLLRLSYLQCFTAVLVNGKLSPWFQLFQGVKQGAILSMMLYICFINGLLHEVLESNLGATAMGVQLGAIGYADDLAFITIDRHHMQLLVNMAYAYSCKWRFDFSPSKCAVMVFGKNTPTRPFVMGGDSLNVVNAYVHVGIKLINNGIIPNIDIKKKIQACKRAFFSIIGTSLSKTTLSPIALSTLYWSVVVPKLLSGVESRVFSENELTEYGKFHKKMAKDIQQLPGSTPDPVVFSMLGWKSLDTYIEYMKIMFVHRILSYSPFSMYRIVFIRRLYFLCLKGLQASTSPVAVIIAALQKYDLLGEVFVMLDSGIIPSKQAWKKVVTQTINDYVFERWRFSLLLYPKLGVFRSVVHKWEPVCWWKAVKALPYLKKSCATIVKLLCGSNVLLVNTQCNLPRNERLCNLCDYNEVEDSLHFILRCPRWSGIRLAIDETIRLAISNESFTHWSGLPDTIKLYIALGLEYPFPLTDLQALRYIYCVNIHRMYRARKSITL